MCLSSSDDNRFKELLQRKSDELDFDVMRVVSVEAASRGEMGERLEDWLEQERQGSMHYMADRSSLRSAPQKLWMDASSIIMFGMGYKPFFSPLKALKESNKGLIASYAQRRDYHDIVKGKLKEFAGFLVSKTDAEVKIFVDTGPLMEKPLAQMAGIGWQGKHTILVSRSIGPWIVLGSILTTFKIAPDEPEEDHCGTCRKCLDICPTKAFPAPYEFDARRCIAYYTTENKELAPRALRPYFGNRIFGCDDCVAVCPWNKYATTCREARFRVSEKLVLPPLEELLKLNDAGFRSFFSATPVKRIGRDRFIRNVLVAAGNARNKSFIPSIIALLVDSSPLVRAMAVWALIETDLEIASEIAKQYITKEYDPLVLKEWNVLEHFAQK